jgi:4-diphosphocytidyl-2C-methyl-D-erythritol kinase
MTGSGASVFGIFATRPAADHAAQALAVPGRFVVACESLGA